MTLQVTKSKKDRDGDIVGLCGSGWSHNKATAAANVRSNAFAYAVAVSGPTVYVRVTTRNGRDYLTTSADGHKPNNLDNLPDC